MSTLCPLKVFGPRFTADRGESVIHEGTEIYVNENILRMSICVFD